MHACMQVWVRTCLQAFLSYSLNCNIAQNATANASQAYSFNLLAKLYVKQVHLYYALRGW